MTAAPDSGKPASRRRLRLRGWWVFLAACVLAAAAIRAWIVAGYTVPTVSMEPFFHGASEGGDRVAVFKPYYDLVQPERFDLVAFSIDRRQLGEQRISGAPADRNVDLVKRAVGLPGEWIEIRDDGDVFTARDDQPLKRVQKTLDCIQSILIPVYRARFEEGFFERWKSYARIDGILKEDRQALETCWDLVPGRLICNAARQELDGRRVGLTFGAEIQDGYLNSERVYEPGLYSVKDVAITLTIEILEAGNGGGVFADLSGEGDEFGFELLAASSGGAGVIIHNGQPVESRRLDRPAGGLKPGRVYTIQFLNIDNQVGLLLDGEVLAFYAYDRDRLAPWCNVPWFGAFGARVAFHEVRIDRDIHYTPAGQFACGEPWPIPPDEFFFLGDNSRMSADSRIFGGVPAAAVIGRPFWVFWPLPRLRFF